MIRVLTTLYNAQPYIGQCINTIQAQTIQDWRCYVLNDLSTDGSQDEVIKSMQNDKRILLVNHPQKRFQVGAYLNALSRDEIDDEDICISIDGDDWLPDQSVFNRVLQAYADPNIWITWGSMLLYQDFAVRPSYQCRPLSAWDDIRSHEWVTSHLRTWKAFLYRAINPRDLRDPNGMFWRMAGDQAFMLPMLEMAGPEHSRYLSDYNYVYNMMNPLNDHTIDVCMQIAMCKAIRALPPYKRLHR